MSVFERRAETGGEAAFVPRSPDSSSFFTIVELANAASILGLQVPPRPNSRHYQRYLLIKSLPRARPYSGGDKQGPAAASDISDTSNTRTKAPRETRWTPRMSSAS